MHYIENGYIIMSTVGFHYKRDLIVLNAFNGITIIKCSEHSQTLDPCTSGVFPPLSTIPHRLLSRNQSATLADVLDTPLQPGERNMEKPQCKQCDARVSWRLLTPPNVQNFHPHHCASPSTNCLVTFPDFRYSFICLFKQWVSGRVTALLVWE